MDADREQERCALCGIGLVMGEVDVCDLCDDAGADVRDGGSLEVHEHQAALGDLESEPGGSDDAF